MEQAERVKGEQKKVEPPLLVETGKDRKRPQIVNLEFPLYSVAGVTVPGRRDGINEDTFALLADDREVTFSLMDDILPRSVGTKGKKEKLAADAGICRSTLSENLPKVVLRRMLSSDFDRPDPEHFDAPFIWFNLRQDEADGNIAVKYVGQGDSFIVAYVPREYGDYRLEIIYAPLEADVRYGRSGEVVLPAGSLVFAGSDGVFSSALMSMKFREWFIKDLLWFNKDYYYQESNTTAQGRERRDLFYDATKWIADRGGIIFGKEVSSYDRTKALKAGLDYLMKIGGRGENFPIIFRQITEHLSDPKVRDEIIRDDTTFIAIKTHEKRIGMPYPEKVRFLYDLITAPHWLFHPSISSRIVKEYGEKTVAKLVEEMIRRKETYGLAFARACALVKLEELSREAKRWFTEKKLVILDDYNFNVHPMIFNEPESEGICNDIGWVALGQSSRYAELTNPKWLKESRLSNQEWLDLLVKEVKLYEIRFLGANESFPEGSWGVLKHTTGQYFTVPGTYITSREGRGILIPTSISGGIYLYEPNFHEEKHGNLFLFSSVASVTAHACIAWSHFMQHPELKGVLVKSNEAKAPNWLEAEVPARLWNDLNTYLSWAFVSEPGLENFKKMLEAEKRLEELGFRFNHTLQGVRIQLS